MNNNSIVTDIYTICLSNPSGLFLGDNVLYRMEELEQLHNNIMFYTSVISISIFLIVLCLYFQQFKPSTKIIIFIFLLLLFVVILVLFMDEDDEIMSKGYQDIMRITRPVVWWLNRTPWDFGGDHPYVNLAYTNSNINTIRVFDEYDPTGVRFRSVLVNMPNNSSWVTQGNYTYLDLGQVNLKRGEPCLDPTRTFEGARLNIGPFKEYNNVNTNDAPVKYIREQPFIKKFN